MLLLVSDANIIIDLENCDLTELAFSLPHDFVVPDVVYEEELKMNHKGILKRGLKKKSLDSSSVSEAIRLREMYGKTSQNDLFCLSLAKQKQGVLLTGDRALRNVAKDEAVECHGMIWIFCELVAYGKLTHKEAYKALERIKETGGRLPWDEAKKQISKVAYKSKIS